MAPNPVQAQGQVQVAVDLPADFHIDGSLRLTVTDATGRMVHELQLPSPPDN